MKRVHGLALQPQWDKKGLPPVQQRPPNPGAPLLELNFPSFFKMTPSILLGPRCNHDLGILLKLPVLSSTRQDELVKDFENGAEHVQSELDKEMQMSFEGVIDNITGCRVSNQGERRLNESREGSSDDLSCGSKLAASGPILPLLSGSSGQKHVDHSSEWLRATETMVEDIIDHEFYSSDYTSKVQPQAEGLLLSMHDSLAKAEKRKYFQTGTDTGEDAMSPQDIIRDRARRMLHRLVSATNRCTHKGFPSL